MYYQAPLFLSQLIDRNSDGKLDIFDFTVDGTHTTTEHFAKWTELRQKFDLNGDGQVSLDEVIYGHFDNKCHGNFACI